MLWSCRTCSSSRAGAAAGFGKELLRLLEDEARKTLGVQALRLRVRTYNARAIHLYEAAGFAPAEQDGTLVTMHKSLAP